MGTTLGDVDARSLKSLKIAVPQPFHRKSRELWTTPPNSIQTLYVNGTRQQSPKIYHNIQDIIRSPRLQTLPCCAMAEEPKASPKEAVPKAGIL